ncbi:hypothetical protein SY88_17730 [Clostridiales bacterium PH28_bin88]|nr:hypothetical protein SY88_17730 [Clostridiales bacterium PH28_bin88]
METWKRHLYILWIATLILMAGMSLIIPFLPLYIEELGVTDVRQVELWAGLVFAANFLTAAIFSPIWGSLADKYGRKVMLLRSGFGMALVVAFMGLATNVYQLLVLRLLMGTVAGFVAAATALLAYNVPKEHSGYALGFLQTGVVAGTVIGPLVGGALAEVIGFRQIFFVTAAMNALAALTVLIGVEEKFQRKEATAAAAREPLLSLLVREKILLAMFAVSFLIQFSLMINQPMITVFVSELGGAAGRVSLMAGMVFAVTGIANIVASPRLGRIGDQCGYHRVLLWAMAAAAFLFLPQAYVENVWQLLFFRFVLGFCLGGLIPAVNAIINQAVPREKQGGAFGLNSTAMFLGNLLGPITGGLLASSIGLRGVFQVTSVLLGLNAVILYLTVYPMLKIKNAAGIPAPVGERVCSTGH